MSGGGPNHQSARPAQASSSAPPPLSAARQAIASEELAANRKRLVTGYAIASALTPSFGSTDFLLEHYWPESTELGLVLTVRVAASLVIGGIWCRLRSRATIQEPELDAWVNFMPPFFAVMVALFCLCTGGVDSPYTDAVNLPVGCYAFVPRRWTKVVLSAVSTVLLFPATFLVCAQFWDLAAAELENPRFLVHLTIETGILACTCFVLAFAAHTLWALRREVFAARSIGRYRAKRRIGRGGMGEVWQAFDTSLRRDVALKVLKLEQSTELGIARFEREVRATSELSHPNTVRIFDFGVTDDGLSYYAMELLEGRSLAEIMRTEGKLPPQRVIHFAVQAARALSEAHARGIVHRDIKPENLFITNTGGENDFLKVLDFGIVRFEQGEHNASLTGTGLVTGTPHYLAPEVLRGGAAKSGADVYALGVVMYQMLTGRSPFTATEGTPLLIAHLTVQPEPPSKHAEIPVDLEGVVLTCLLKDPTQRFADARELVDALLNCEDAGRHRPTPHLPSKPQKEPALPEARTLTATDLPIKQPH